MITTQALEKTSPDKDIWLADKSPRGEGQFCARITKAGSRTFYFRYTGPEKRQARLKIGTYDPQGQNGLTLKQARTEAKKLNILYQSGITDLKSHFETERRLNEAARAAELARIEAERRTAEVEASRMTVAELFGRWSGQELKARRDAKEVQRMITKDALPMIGSLPAHEIRKAHIMQIIDPIIQRNAPRMARLLFTNLRTMFRFALTRDLIDIDPTAGIDKKKIGGRDKERERVLTSDEIKQLAQKMPNAGLIPTTEAAIWLYLATGCRAGELLRSRWEDVNFDKQEWLIPTENAKNHEPLTVYLSDFAIQQFNRLRQFNNISEWIFPARHNAGHVATQTITVQIRTRQNVKPIKNKTKKIGTLSLPGGPWHVHDLRRSAATLMVELGVSPVVVERCLNHREQNKMQRIYQRYSYASEMQEAWSLLGERLEALTADNSTVAKVIPLRSNDKSR